MISTPKYLGPDIKTILAEKGLDSDGRLWRGRLENTSGREVERALASATGSYSVEKLLAFISPAAEDYLEEMAQLARQLTVQRFGQTIRLYAPLYLSNSCVNSCRYCGFNRENKFKRTRLTIEQALTEADIIAAEGFRDILLVSSEDRKIVSIEYLTELAKKLRSKFSSISIEVYQMSVAEYAKLVEAGVKGVTVYQETYDRQAYAYYHRDGPKSDYDNRLDVPDRVAAAGMREIGLGTLLGLADWRVETLALAEHAHYLVKRYWRSRVSFSFPRLRPAYSRLQTSDPLGLGSYHLLSDKNLVQMMMALRLCFADAGLVLSTRERAELRDRLIKLGTTKMSAGSKTCPGGYSEQTDVPLKTGMIRAGVAGRQFEIDDSRSPAQVAAMIRAQGAEPVWKDWDSTFSED
ncbi:MAG: 2-iminoacetate synthase ThiH [Planctomycetota bacterium]|jgi:2-iminoacetate synthase